MRSSANLLNQKFSRLLVIEKTNKRHNSGSIIWKCKCDCGNLIEVPTQSLTSGNTKSCGCLQKEKAKATGHNTLIDLTNKVFGRLTVIKYSGTINDRSYWQCKCKCGTICEIEGYRLRSGKTSSCGCLSSIGEEKISLILKENNISFTKEKTFNSCRFKDSNALARFDFYINEKYLIEFDGIQHFEYKNSGWDTEEKFQKTQQRDKYKNQWCKDNNIPLIRIPYTKLDTLCIEDLMLETTQFRVV